MACRRIRQMQLHRSYFIFTISTINYFSYRDVCNVYRITSTISCPVSYLRARTSMCASIARGEKVCEGMPWAPKKSWVRQEGYWTIQIQYHYKMTAIVRQIFFIIVQTFLRNKKTFLIFRKVFMTYPGIEPGFPPWEGGVLAAWPIGRICRFRQLPYNTIGNWICPDKFQKNMKKILDCKKYPIN